MEICEHAESWKEQGDDFVFDHIKIITKSFTGDYFYAKFSKRVHPDAIDTLEFDGLEFDADKDICSQFASFIANALKLDKLDLVPIPIDVIWPRYADFLTIASEPTSRDCYVKRASLLNYETDQSFNLYHMLVMEEAQVCETLLKNPHPNIARYRGCEVLDGRIRGLCFDKYAMTLRERLETGNSLDKQLCLQGIKDGIHHLHSLGLTHNDMNPRNVMVDASDNPVIIDFDSCKHEGEELVKCGTPDWCLEDMQYAARENDFFGLSKLEELLSKIPEQQVNI
ncbi:hypothetical protein FSARC_10736 [Fusarium sarcochroum]|uniref:Protein kinase domain-containing protein n=1 Tax=Fusarium sarcochroum TaxID=1208366 RepID=A0A8H4TKB1_9HYPO|nr:hypothetical protein FSARC_10736 [Fusarium sarcochroum]